ncbi:hypothetical protein [Dermatophilus congolensis]|uniref:hypothetical protein n=1 Tax=Dermatophilus congolensis TaxID=1863 RepID=UPI001AAF0D3C|nr:hypothetical protein [Dermatophilus congolensis]MBO3142809.1 DUF2207 domain-containing protein [Dermatophilus congolensis]MBO3151802.1 DUF2207 domain-containing protein [Dermatophilus congolensis]MBO3161195.1 DUF2207 domain-containing protein [Dermatophilus congolensis]MBO3163084.1 DUF2207 domain-containing protein [Dermatophilus congolensis]MBO3176638.1 DUF2207 domain-containing protein [Dermatophilus congolensis]
MGFIFLILAVVLGVAVLSRLLGGSDDAHDEVFEGVAPGIIPASETEAPTRQITAADRKLPVAVRFEAPERMRPEETGIIRDRNTSGSDVAAAFVAMTVEGYYRIENRAGDTPETTDTGTASTTKPAKNTKDNWIITRTDKSPDDLEPLRRNLYESIFATGDTVALEAAKANMRGAALTLQQEINTGAIAKGWYTAGGASRTAVGSALAAQTAGFQEYLGRAEQKQLQYEEAAGIFSRFLPWAVGLGVAKEWSGHFADIAAQAEAEGYGDALMATWAADLAWWTGMAMLLNPGMFDGLGEAIGELTEGIEDFASDMLSFGSELFDEDPFTRFGGIFEDDTDSGVFGGLFDDDNL